MECASLRWNASNSLFCFLGDLEVNLPCATQVSNRRHTIGSLAPIYPKPLFGKAANSNILGEQVGNIFKTVRPSRPMVICPHKWMAWYIEHGLITITESSLSPHFPDMAGDSLDWGYCFKTLRTYEDCVESSQLLAIISKTEPPVKFEFSIVSRWGSRRMGLCKGKTREPGAELGEEGACIPGLWKALFSYRTYSQFWLVCKCQAPC